MRELGLILGCSILTVLVIFLWVRWSYYRRLCLTQLKNIEQLNHEYGNLQALLQERDHQLYEIHHQTGEEMARRAAAEERAKMLANMEVSLKEAQQQILTLKGQNIELQTTLEHERSQAAEKLRLIDQAESKLIDVFKSLSMEALSANNHHFLHLAQSTLEKFQETAKGDLSLRQQAIVEMLAPVHQALNKVDGKIVELEKQRVGAYEVLRQQVSDLILTQKELRSETSNLVKALRAPTVRGQWGEIQLKRVVEMAGMVSHCDFLEQVNTQTEGGRLRPDMIINLPGGKKIIVDAKAPLSAYLEALEASDETIRQERLQEHARQVRNHVRALSQRSYWEQFDASPEFVVLFLPGETFFSAALDKDPSLIEVGVKEKVILATPTTLIALLRAVAFGWRQETITENALLISSLGRELYKRLSDLGGHFQRLGRHLGQAIDSYNQAIGTMERRVLVTARKFQDLDKSDEEIEDLTPIEHMPRSIQATELISENPTKDIKKIA
jgi:DNA recombination protein RmuC